MRPVLISALVLTLLGGLPMLAAASADGVPSIVIDGSKLPSDVPALVSGDHVLVPLRGVFEQFGASVSYDESSAVATAALGATTVQVTVGSVQARINGRPATMDVAARELAGRVMIPLRFVAQALGVSVDYDASANTVVIVSGLRPGSFAAYSGGPVYTNVTHTAPSVESVRPESGTIVGSQYPSIYARFAGGTSAVDPGTVQVLVDGQDVTDQSTVSSAYVSYTPIQALTSGMHSVQILGQSGDGTPFNESWTFRVDAGSATDYTVGSYGGGGGYGGYGAGYPGYGFGSPAFGFGWPWFHRFGFAPPGFSVFTPGPLFFTSGNFIEVVLISRFFPFGTGFFTISGIPGQCAFAPWLGNPGMFWGAVQVPAGAVMNNAVIEAHFKMPDGRQVAIRSTAPLQIEGQRHSLPADLHYAVLPHLTNQPHTLGQAVVFDRVEPRKEINEGSLGSAPGGALGVQSGSFGGGTRVNYGMHEPASVRAPVGVREPGGLRQPIGLREPIGGHAPAMTRQPLEPARGFAPFAPVFRPFVPQWQIFEPSMHGPPMGSMGVPPKAH
jgi:hypothetical protein